MLRGQARVPYRQQWQGHQKEAVLLGQQYVEASGLDHESRIAAAMILSLWARLRSVLLMWDAPDNARQSRCLPVAVFGWHSLSNMSPLSLCRLQVEVDLDKGIATVQVEAASQIDAFNTMPQMVETITGLGFQAEPHFGEAEV